MAADNNFTCGAVFSGEGAELDYFSDFVRVATDPDKVGVKCF